MSAAEELEPTVFDGVSLGPVLGRGGMGVVYEATDVSLQRQIAVKTLREDRVTPGHAAALLAEARITSAVTHPGVLPIHDLRPGPDGRPRILLERIEGRPWNELLRDPRAVLHLHGHARALPFHIGVLAQVCSAVHAAHARGIVHRDLKPGNVMVAEQGDVWLLDWGLAVTLDPEADPRLPRLEQSTGGAGTPQYMAPEMVSARFGELGPWTDVYLLGGLLFQILWGRPPHDGANSWAMVLDACRNGVQIPDEGPEELVELCRRCLQRDPKDRIQDAQTVRRALLDWQAHRTSVELGQEGRAQQALLTLLLESASEQARSHELFGATVFAFHRALEAWPGNADAREGLAETVEAMVHHALTQEDLDGAHAALGYLAEPPSELVDRVQEARVRRDRLTSQRARWRALGLGALQTDAMSPQRTSLLIGGAAMLAASAVSSLTASALTGLTTGTLLAAAAGGMLAVLVAVGRSALEPMGRWDKRIAGHLVVFAVSRVLVLAAAHLYALPGSSAVALELGLAMMLMGLQTLAFRHRFWVVSLVAGLGAVLCVVMPASAALFQVLAYVAMGGWLLRADRQSRGTDRPLSAD